MLLIIFITFFELSYLNLLHDGFLKLYLSNYLQLGLSTENYFQIK